MFSVLIALMAQNVNAADFNAQNNREAISRFHRSVSLYPVLEQHGIQDQILGLITNARSDLIAYEEMGAQIRTFLYETFGGVPTESQQTILDQISMYLDRAAPRHEEPMALSGRRINFSGDDSDSDSDSESNEGCRKREKPFRSPDPTDDEDNESFDPLKSGHKQVKTS